MANGHVQPDIQRIDRSVHYAQRPHLFLNDGTGRFEERTVEEGPLADSLVARGAAYGDYDGDGDLDILVTENEGGAHLWRNDTRTSPEQGRPHYLRVRLEGTKSNRDGIGARVLVESGGEVQERWLRTGSSYLSSIELALTFGLGERTRVDRVTVHWPSGEVDRLTNVEANQTLHVVEGKGRAAV